MTQCNAVERNTVNVTRSSSCSIAIKAIRLMPEGPKLCWCKSYDLDSTKRDLPQNVITQIFGSHEGPIYGKINSREML